MKQGDDIEHFQANHGNWLARLSQADLLAALIDVSSEGGNGVYVVDQDQHVLYWNEAMESITGVTTIDAYAEGCADELSIEADSKKSKSQLCIPRGNASELSEISLLTHSLTDINGRFAGGIGVVSTAAKAKDNEDEIKPHDKRGSINFHGIISRSPDMEAVFRIIQNAAQSEATVLVRGESGSGKELVAKAIHALSARSDSPFLAVNCAALSSNLLESELFGHVRGAFTGAIKDHDGLFKRANGGTLFLDEVAEMPLDLQAKLLRVIQERNYVPVGGSRTVEADVRIVAATHRSLREEVKHGHFREDLMYRLRVVPIFLPALRERREDISLLIWHFINLHNDKRVRVIEKIDPDAMKVLLDYGWPGNVRELHNVVEYAFAVGRGSTLRLAELPPEFREPRLGRRLVNHHQSAPKLSEDEELKAIKQALAQCQNRAGEAAKLLGMSRATFWRKRKQYAL